MSLAVMVKLLSPPGTLRYSIEATPGSPGTPQGFHSAWNDTLHMKSRHWLPQGSPLASVVVTVNLARRYRVVFTGASVMCIAAGFRTTVNATSSRDTPLGSVVTPPVYGSTYQCST